MTTTLRPASPAPRNGSATPKPIAPAARPSVRPNRRRVGAGVGILVVSVMGVVTIIGRSADRQSVLALAVDVPAGTTIEQHHLTTVELPVDTAVPTIAIDRSGDVVGQVAVVSLMQGTLLAQTQLSVDGRVPEGMALLGAVLDPGQYPVGLRAGDQVELISAAPATSALLESTVVNLGTAEVREVAEPPTGAHALAVSLLVPAQTADAIAAAGAQGRISLVVVGAR